MTLKDLILYFLKLGATCFGGPVAITSQIHQDLIKDKKWFSEFDFKSGLSLAQLTPGPMASQLVMYLGWLKRGILGSSIATISFTAPSFILVIAIGFFYSKYSGLSWLQNLFEVISIVVVPLISISAFRLAKSSLQRDPLFWTIAVIAGCITYYASNELFSVFLAAGFFTWAIKYIKEKKLFSISFEFCLFFLKAGSFIFGSGLVILPFLQAGLVAEHHWITQREFLDAVAISMITPGPALITVAFIGYLISGVAGAVVGIICVFLPCFIFTVAAAPLYKKLLDNQGLHAWVEGMSAAAVGALIAAVIMIGQKSIVDWFSISLAAAVFLAFFLIKRVPPVVLVAIFSAIGFYLKSSSFAFLH